MSMIKGLDELQRKLDDLANKAVEVDGSHELSLSELFPDYFMLRFTQFSTMEEMFESSGFEITTQQDFENIPEDKWDIFIETHTQFVSWEEMKQAAANEWVRKKMGFESEE